VSSAKRLKAFQVILRARQHEIDALSAELAAIRARQAEITGHIETLDRRRDEEGHAQTLEAAPFVAGFLKAIAVEQVGLGEQLSALDEIGSKLEQEVRERFIDMRSWQTSCDRLEAAQNYDDRRKESAQMDEVARATFTHHRGTS
jgi:flagellar biosynthesis chaperone FliJ